MTVEVGKTYRDLKDPKWTFRVEKPERGNFYTCEILSPPHMAGKVPNYDATYITRDCEVVE